MLSMDWITSRKETPDSQNATHCEMRRGKGRVSGPEGGGGRDGELAAASLDDGTVGSDGYQQIPSYLPFSPSSLERRTRSMTC